MGGLEEIKDYIALLEQRLGWDLIIYDECGLLASCELSELPQVGKWHTNPYCLKIKESRRLHTKCVRLKQAFVNKVLAGNGVVKSICFCGVTEYAIPIRYQNHLVCIVAATGFRGELPDRIYQNLSARISCSYERFLQLRASALLPPEQEVHVSAAIGILSRMLCQYILENTRIPAMLDDADNEGNEHILLAKQYIAQHFPEPIQTSNVARHCHLSKSHLEHLFCRATGHGIAEEIRICRLNYAKELLCTTDYSVKYIAYISGFSSSDYFATAFKKQFLASPLQYRKLKQINR